MTDDTCPDGGNAVDATAAVTATPTETEAETERSQVRKVLDIASREYSVVFRARWTLGLTLLFAAFSVGIVAFGTSAAGPQRYGAVVATLTELAVYLVPLAALVFGYDTIVGAAKRGTFNMLLVLPISRGRVLIGKYLGRVGALAGSLVVGLTMGGALAFRYVGLAGVGQYVRFVLAAVGVGAAFLAVSVLVSAAAREKTHALGGALLLWVWFVFVHDLVALAAVVSFGLPDPVVTALVLANPADLLRVIVLAGLNTTSGGIAGTLAATSVSVPLAVVALGAWIIVPIVVASRVVNRKQV